MRAIPRDATLQWQERKSTKTDRTCSLAPIQSGSLFSSLLYLKVFFFFYFTGIT